MDDSASAQAQANDSATGGTPAPFDTSPGAAPIFVQADGGAFAPQDQGTAQAESASASQVPGLAPGKPNALGGNVSTVPAAVALPAAGSTWSNMVQQESGGHQFDPAGNPLRSPKGAVGIAQVMPQTGPEAAELAGLPWDPKRFENDPAYNAQLGAAYFKKQLDTFGTPDKAAAAYNAGPGRVSSAIARAASPTGTGNYLDYLPPETQYYVKAVTGNKGRSFGALGQASEDQGGEAPASDSAAAAKAALLAQNNADQAKSAAEAHANKIRELYSLMAPGHKLTPIDYDPFKVAPDAGKAPAMRPYVPPEVKQPVAAKVLPYKLGGGGQPFGAPGQSASAAAGAAWGNSGDTN